MTRQEVNNRVDERYTSEEYDEDKQHLVVIDVAQV